jgi:GNAT superfamily N-acetyltransferase
MRPAHYESGRINDCHVAPNEEILSMKVERLTHDDADEAIEALCAAFFDYPVMRYTLADAGDLYEERLRALIGFLCRKRLVRGWPVLGVRAGGRIAAAALINEPDGGPAPAEIETLREQLVDLIGEDAHRRFMRYETESDVDAPEEPRHFLGVLGVHPEHQGKGLAKILLDDLARICDEHPLSAGICLNTEDPANVPLYEHMGYQILGHRQIDADLETWCMFRPRNPA